MAEHTVYEAVIDGRTDTRPWVGVERVLGDRLQALGLEVLWTGKKYNYDFGGHAEKGHQRAYSAGVELVGPHVRRWFRLLLDQGRIAYPMLMCDEYEPWLRAVVRHQQAFEAAYRIGGQHALLEVYAQLHLTFLVPGYQLSPCQEGARKAP